MSHITDEPWVNHFVAKETPIKFQNCFVSQGWHLHVQWHQKIVCVGALAPKPRTLSVACWQRFVATMNSYY